MCQRIAPGAFLYEKVLHGCSRKTKRYTYQVLVWIITFLTYASYHAAKRPMSVVKGQLSPNCTRYTSRNETCPAWAPFDTNGAKDIFGLLDCAFLMTYALSMFASGYIAEHTNLRVYLSGGMVLTGLLTSMLGMAYYWKLHTLSYFFIINVLVGITQSTGWPCVVEAVGSWFPEGRRGFIMGIWNTHTSVGNIIGTASAAAFLKHSWGMSFIVPGIIIAAMGIAVYLFLIPDPELVDIEINSHSLYTRLPDNDIDPKREQSDNISIWGALKIPGVVEYSMCLFFAKLVSYTFLFWLPFYITEIEINDKAYDDDKAALWAIWFDISGAVGGVLAGVLVDLTQCPGIINMSFLTIAAPFLYLFMFQGTESITSFLLYMILSGFFVNGPYTLITTAVSASLGSHECLQGNTKAMAVVTSIIDATGSLGAAIGPLLAGMISSSSWDNVFYMLLAADVCGALLLTRQATHEISQLLEKRRMKELSLPYSKDSSHKEPSCEELESVYISFQGYNQEEFLLL